MEPHPASTEQWNTEDFAYLRNAIDSGPVEEGSARVRDAGVSNQQTNTDQSPRPTSSHEVPPRLSSARKHLPSPRERRAKKGTTGTSPPRTSPSDGHLVGHKTTKSLDLAPSDPSPLIPRQMPPPRESSAKQSKSVPHRTSASPAEVTQDGTTSHLMSNTPSAEAPTQPLPLFSRQATADGSDSKYSPHVTQELKAAVLHSASGNPPSNAFQPRQNVQSVGSTASPSGAETSSRSQTNNYDPISPPLPTWPSSNFRSTKVPEHMQLPPSSEFPLDNSTRTSVSTEWNPSITSETRQVHYYPQIYKPIVTHHHIHHHYVYEQPIKVIEILPAKHYRINEAGEKEEIEAPKDWVVPDSMKPTPGIEEEVKAQLEPTTRHYVVDEAHPRGQLEAPA